MCDEAERITNGYNGVHIQAISLLMQAWHNFLKASERTIELDHCESLQPYRLSCLDT